MIQPTLVGPFDHSFRFLSHLNYPESLFENGKKHPDMCLWRVVKRQRILMEIGIQQKEHRILYIVLAIHTIETFFARTG